MIHLRGFTKPAVLANVHHAVFSAELQIWLDLLYQKLYKERKVWGLYKCFSFCHLSFGYFGPDPPQNAE